MNIKSEKEKENKVPQSFERQVASNLGSVDVKPFLETVVCEAESDS